MKRHIFICVIVIALSVTNGVGNPAAQVREPRIQSGVFEFTEPVNLHGVVLQGQYLFLHHQGMMDRGKPCIFVYHANSGGFVTSFHCRPVKRDRVGHLSVVLSRAIAFGLLEIEEIQFAGSTEGHLVQH